MEYLRAQAARFPHLDLDGPSTEGLSPRDAALAHTICDAVARRWITLRAVAQSFLKHPFDRAPTPTQAALLAGAAQLLLLDRIPPHAAVSESVAYTRVRSPRTAPVVNAVLRGLTRALTPPDAPPAPSDPRATIPRADGGVVTLSRAVFDQDPHECLAQASGCPAPLLASWRAQFGDEVTRRLAHHSLLHPPIVLNTAFARSPLPENLVPHDTPGCHVYTGEGAGLRTLLTGRADLWVQDAASTAAVSLALQHAGDPLRHHGTLLVDLCAGQGTKTRHLAAAFPHAKILATDVDATRLGVLRGVFDGHPRVSVVEADALDHAAARSAALVLLDVPCSNTGVLPRRPEAKYRCDEPQMTRLVNTQRSILRRGVSLLAPDGLLLYSTCSLEHAENEAQARWAESLDLRLVAEERVMPLGLPGDSPARYRDGAYAALLRQA